MPKWLIILIGILAFVVLMYFVGIRAKVYTSARVSYSVRIIPRTGEAFIFNEMMDCASAMADSGLSKMIVDPSTVASTFPWT